MLALSAFSDAPFLAQLLGLQSLPLERLLLPASNTMCARFTTPCV